MSDNHFEKTSAGMIDWKMEADRANRLYADASYRIEALEAELREAHNRIEFLSKFLLRFLLAPE